MIENKVKSKENTYILLQSFTLPYPSLPYSPGSYEWQVRLGGPQGRRMRGGYDEVLGGVNRLATIR